MWRYGCRFRTVSPSISSPSGTERERKEEFAAVPGLVMKRKRKVSSWCPNDKKVGKGRITNSFGHLLYGYRFNDMIGEIAITCSELLFGDFTFHIKGAGNVWLVVQRLLSRHQDPWVFSFVFCWWRGRSLDLWTAGIFLGAAGRKRKAAPKKIACVSRTSHKERASNGSAEFFFVLTADPVLVHNLFLHHMEATSPRKGIW